MKRKTNPKCIWCHCRTSHLTIWNNHNGADVLIYCRKHGVCWCETETLSISKYNFEIDKGSKFSYPRKEKTI